MRAVIDRCSNLSVVLHLMLTDRAGLESLLHKDPVRDSVSVRKEMTCWKMSVVSLPYGLIKVSLRVLHIIFRFFEDLSINRLQNVFCTEYQHVHL